MQLQRQDYISMQNQLQQYSTSTPSRSRPETALSNLTNHQQNQNQAQSLTPNNNKSYMNMMNMGNCNQSNFSQHNNSKICYPAEENMSEINLRVSPKFRDQQNRTPQSNNLEQENQILKSQIEMLRNALVGLCKNQQLEIPELLPLIQQQQQLTNQTPPIIKQNSHKQLNPEERQSYHNNESQSKENQSPSYMQMNTSRNSPNNKISFQNDENSNNITIRNENPNQTIQSSCSPSKSRRKRSQRQKSPTKYQVQSQNKKVQSPCFRDEMPLQVQSNKRQTDDTLFLDKSSIEIYQNQANQTKDLFNQNEDSIMMISQVKQNIQLNDENEDIDCSPRDTSQIQIKYARMLEELENESPHLSEPESPTKQDNQFATLDFGVASQKTTVIKSQNEFSEKKQLTKNEDDILPQAMETMRSNKYEYEQFYEHEINNLRNELQMFAMEEQKILQLITTKNEPGEVSPSKLEEVKEIDQTLEEDQVQHTPTRIRLPLLKEESTFELSQDEKNEILMNNLREAFLELKDVLSGDQEEDSFIKPIKITSPSQNDEIETKFSQCNMFQMNDITQQNSNNTFETDMKSPMKKQMTLMTTQNSIQEKQSARTSTHSVQNKSPYIDKSYKLQQFSKECSSYINQGSSTNNFVSTKSTGRVRENADYKNQNEKSPIIQTFKVNNRNLKSKSRTPIRVMNNNEDFKNCAQSLQQQQSDIIAQRIQPYDSNDYISNPIQMETIEMLAKRKSLAEGLKQQEEPLSDEDERKNSIRKHYQRFNKLRYQAEEQNSETDDIILDLRNSEMDYGSINIMSRDSSCIQKEKQDLERMIEDRKNTIHNAENYFGLYSFEKSEQMKNQRCESIKKAEELLSQLISEKSPNSRPSYLASSRSRIDQDTSRSPIRFKQEPQPVLLQPTELSFNAEVNHSKKPSINQKQVVKESTFSNQKLSIDSNEVINLQINNGVMSSYEQCLTEQYRFDDEEENLRLGFNKTGVQPNIGTSDLKASDLQTPFKYEQRTCSYMMSPMDNTSNYQEMMSELSSNYKLNTETPIQSDQQNAKRRSMQLKTPFQRIKEDHSNYNSRGGEAQSTTNHSTQNKSQSCDNTFKRKYIANSKNFDNKPETVAQNKFNHNTSISDQLNTIDKQQTSLAQPAIIQYQKQYNLSTIDTEAFYMDRSKSVLKRRDDLLKRKQLEIQSKIESKNMKYDQMMNTRNVGSMSQISRDKSSGKSQVIVEQQQNQTPSQVKSHYHSRRTGLDSRSLTPIKSNVNNSTINNDQSQRQSTIVVQHSYQTIDECQQKQQPEMSRKSSVGKTGIRLDKKQQNSISNTNGIQSGCYPISANLNLQTPSGISSVKSISTAIHTGIPSTSQSKSSKITSECSSYRKRMSDVSSQAENSSITYKESKNTTQQKKQQPTSLLKNNIVNKTLRINQNKPKEYVQLKHEKQRNIQLEHIVQSVANTQLTSEKQSLNHTMSSQQSHIATSSNNSRSMIQNYQPQIMSQSKPSSGLSSLMTSQSQNKVEFKKIFNQSRSINRMSGQNNHHQSSKSSNYNTNQKSINLLKTVEYVEEDVFLEAEQSVDNRKNHKGECRNCQRLINKGLSTDFCLDHYSTPRVTDE